jgi:hypothetical protein
MCFLIPHPTLAFTIAEWGGTNLACAATLTSWVMKPPRGTASSSLRTEPERELQWRGNALAKGLAARQHPCSNDSSGQYLPD